MHSSLTDAEKRQTAAAWKRFDLAIKSGNGVYGAHADLQAVYKGGAAAYIAGFGAIAPEARESWMDQLLVHLRDEIEPEFWHS